jgi:hypothetical protein
MAGTLFRLRPAKQTAQNATIGLRSGPRRLHALPFQLIDTPLRLFEREILHDDSLRHHVGRTGLIADALLYEGFRLGITRPGRPLRIGEPGKKPLDSLTVLLVHGLLVLPVS